MFITNDLVDCSEAVKTVIGLVIKHYKITDQAVLESIERKLNRFLEPLRQEDIQVVCEYPYIDRVYRDSYYSYYSSKFGAYFKEAIRLSFFDKPIESDDFRREGRRLALQEQFLGFLVIRPTFPFIIGRNIISPKALLQCNFQVCKTTFSTTVDGIILSVNGFPHASQDRETLTCAETTLWSVMEYFSTRYPDYSPALPAKIRNISRTISAERSLPARGMRIHELSFVLRELGFGTRMYSNANFTDGAYLNENFFDLLSCYLESGIPVILSLKEPGNERSGHAAVCIGHELADYSRISTITPERLGNVSLYDHDRIVKKFIFSDDNLPPYFQGNLVKPYAGHYREDWHQYEIDSFVVPLYHKVYLEAYIARKYIKEYISQEFNTLKLEDTPVELCMRCFLASSRSYKNHVATNQDMPWLLKNAILDTSLPRFIWVCEAGSVSATQEGKAEGFIILDATEANFRYNNPLIMLALNGKLRNFAGSWGAHAVAETSVDARETIPFDPVAFESYQSNLT